MSSPPRGHVAEWLRNGLQNRVHQFNSGRGLQQNQQLMGNVSTSKFIVSEESVGAWDRAKGALMNGTWEVLVVRLGGKAEITLPFPMY
jgi:hypothetical protein